MVEIYKETGRMIKDIDDSFFNAILQKQFEYQPELKERYNSKQIQKYIDDTKYHLSYLSEAITNNRQVLFNKIYKSLNWGGGFIFFEKVRAPDARFQDMMNQIYQEYKIDNGINEKQVINKSLSLRNVLEPYSSEENKKYLKRAGFKDFMTIMKSHSFEGFLAIK